MTVGDFAERVAVLAIAHKFSVVSWGRSERRNKDVGGDEDSVHRFFLAVDVVLDHGEDPDRLEASAVRIGLEVVREPGSFHIQAPKPVKRSPAG